MNNDLISRSELKKAIETYDKFACLPDTRLIPFSVLNEPEKDYEPYVHLRDILNAIDNAPTVEERPQGDFISREALKKEFDDYIKANPNISGIFEVGKHIIDNAPTVERQQGEWIPITYRPLTVDERIAFADHYGVEYCDTLEEKAFACPMPEDGQSILISTSWGVVEDVVDNDIDGEGFICYGLEINGDWDGVDAWMPKPEPYKKGGAEE